MPCWSALQPESSYIPVRAQLPAAVKPTNLDGSLSQRSWMPPSHRFLVLVVSRRYRSMHRPSKPLSSCRLIFRRSTCVTVESQKCWLFGASSDSMSDASSITVPCQCGCRPSTVLFCIADNFCSSTESCEFVSKCHWPDGTISATTDKKIIKKQDHGQSVARARI